MSKLIQYSIYWSIQLLCFYIFVKIHVNWGGEYFATHLIKNLHVCMDMILNNHSHILYIQYCVYIYIFVYQKVYFSKKKCESATPFTFCFSSVISRCKQWCRGSSCSSGGEAGLHSVQGGRIQVKWVKGGLQLHTSVESFLLVRWTVDFGLLGKLNRT